MRNSSLVALIGVMLVTMTGFGVFLPIFPFLALSTGAGASHITWALGAYSLGQVIAAPIWGRISDRIGRKPVLVWGLIGTAISYVLLAHVDNVFAMGAIRFASGLMAGNAGAAFAAAADLADEKTRARNMGLLGAAVGAGFMAGPALGAALVGHEPERADFARICFVSAGFAATAALIALFAFRETLTKGATPSQTRGSLSLLRRYPALLTFIGTTWLIIFAQALLESTFGLWGDSAFGWGPREVGWALAGMGLMAALLQGGGTGALSKRLGDLGMLRLGLIGLALGLATLALAQHLALVIVALMLIAIGGLATPALQSLASAQAEERERGAALGLNQSAAALGRVAGPAISGLVFETFGHAAPFWLASGLAVLALVIALPLHKGERAPIS